MPTKRSVAPPLLIKLIRVQVCGPVLFNNNKLGLVPSSSTWWGE